MSEREPWEEEPLNDAESYAVGSLLKRMAEYQEQLRAAPHGPKRDRLVAVLVREIQLDTAKVSSINDARKARWEARHA